MDFKKLANKDLLISTEKTSQREKQLILELLEHLIEIERRDLILQLGYRGMWEYLHKGLKYSEAAASERLAAMRLLQRTPQAKVMLEEQKISFTVGAKIQHFVKAVRKTEKRVISKDETVALLNACAGKSSREVEKILISQSPVAALPKERVRELSKDHSELKLVVDTELLVLLSEAKTLLGTADQAETIKRSLKMALEQKRKMLGLSKITNVQKTADVKAKHSGATQAPALKRVMSDQLRTLKQLRSVYIPIHMKRALWNRGQSRCEFIGPQGRCTSNHKLQGDHIHPRALGGTTVLNNLRLLCANHNLSEARRMGLKRPE